MIVDEADDPVLAELAHRATQEERALDVDVQPKSNRNELTSARSPAQTPSIRRHGRSHECRRVSR